MMATKGGNSPRLKGARFEAEVAADQRRFGRWCERIRQGQGEIVDLVAIDPNSYPGRCSVYFLQCRISGNLSDAEQEQLSSEARLVGAFPILAWKSDGKIQYTMLL